ncbi:hypothetical protein D9757_002797 [Collybiopsis confluens]|uniref:Uncharacterized protein n=1 Tax=Collybiopsis confluens TaxID=2823264 RepID=A0A8H5MDR1_9AGAR|nr:hypothetical protein D9757_002797 [Collybiopsis confluens]
MRLRSEEIPQRGAQMLGIVHNSELVLYPTQLVRINDGLQDELHLHPIDSTHQFRPTLTYLDSLSRRTKRQGGADSDSDSDDGPPPDPDDPSSPAVAPKRKEKKVAGESKEVLSAKRAADKTGNLNQLSNAKRDMLAIIRAEQDEPWTSLQFCGIQTEDASHSLDTFFSSRDEGLSCTTDVTTFLR